VAGASDKLAKTIPIALAAAHLVGVDTHREAGIGVAELGHHEGHRLVQGRQDRGKRCA
jgi:hypothetical protein